MIRELLLAKHSRAQMLRIVEIIKTEPGRTAGLMQLFLGKDKLLSQRAAWAVRHLSQQVPELVEPYLESMVGNLRRRSDLHDAIKRNTLGILDEVEVTTYDYMWGELVSTCFDYLTDFDTKVGIKCLAMSIIWKICEHEPDLSGELKLLIEEQMEYQSNGFKSKGKKILKAMAKRQ
ncbi:MAG: hypothetical protein AAGG68_04105 [Bacteroidota bacterium]